jgi:hypothetical protein
MLLLLDKEEILSLHAQLIDIFGGIHGVRDEAGLRLLFLRQPSECTMRTLIS